MAVRQNPTRTVLLQCISARQRKAKEIAATVALVSSGNLAVSAVLPSAPTQDTDFPNTAAQAFSWGAPDREDGFNGPASLNALTIFDGRGHNGNGRRTALAVSVSDSLLRTTAHVHGNCGVMALNPVELQSR